ncbi:toprim domain-containing protein [Staphylococcus auricularis]|uniref:Topiosmerase n=1 Tax=Staphylococcus auricularis TaxID=29379 RepID=A0AAP8TT84_9STAP|nr:toprim domain-containing protein [Staphylococcus auricularis]MCE5037576.1 toprim domain-containing protein [Staphylococcus auricularis]MCG7342446.1 toprim domain-containing protein [Staphylococcus auricularis]MDC6327913.1 toprim domain-containing protein [Staphylococcus auricularis]MDN4533894.1 toprim domain-containing protein [Staphylococcus auricularis]MEB6569901.1 toprim domain-containing protein [Staphylococcus auricularis]
MSILNKVIIVEGKSDKKRVKQVIDEPVQIICTHGTMSVDKLDNMIESLYDHQVYILVDSDCEGEKIRKWFKRYLSESKHIRVDKQYCEVANCPKPYLSKVLSKHGFQVQDEEQKAKEQLAYIAERVSLLT